jgi:hypothetical protein
MTTFKAKEPGWMSRLSSSAALYLALAVFVFGFTLYFFAFEAKRDTESVVIDKLERAIPGNRLPPTPTQQKSEESRPQEIARSAKQTVAAEALVATAAPSPTAAQNPTFPPIRILFVEGSPDTFPGGSGTIAKEDIYERNGRDLADSKFFILAEKRSRDLHARREFSDSYWTHDRRLGGDAQKIGLSVSVIPQETSAARTRLEVYFSVQWPEPSSAPQVAGQKADGEFTVRTLKTPPFSVEISPMTVFFYGIPLPHRPVGARETDFRDLLSQNPILKMMTSPRFLATPPQSEFFVLFESNESE